MDNLEPLTAEVNSGDHTGDEIVGKCETTSNDRSFTPQSELRDADFVTLLTSANGELLTKRWRQVLETGERVCLPYDNALHFTAEQRRIVWLGDIRDVIASLLPTQCLILGRLKDGVDASAPLRRLLYDRKLDDGTIEKASFEDAGHNVLPLDVENLPARDDNGEFDPLADPDRALDCVVSRLPPEFAEADFLWQWTSSAGMKPGIRMRLFCWLSRPMTGAQMKAWLRPYLIKTTTDKTTGEKTSTGFIDGAIFGAVQPIYAAAPIFLDGIPNPVAERCGIRLYLGDVAPPEGAERVSGADAPDAAPGANASPARSTEAAGQVYSDDDREEARRLLIGISPNKTREEWLPVGAVLHRVFGGDDTGLRLFQQWNRGDMFKGAFTMPADAQHRGDDEIARVYASFTGVRLSGPEAGLQTLRNLARAEGWDPIDPAERYGDTETFAGCGDAGTEPAEGAAAGSTSCAELMKLPYPEMLCRIRDILGQDATAGYTPPPAPPLFLTAAQLAVYGRTIRDDVWDGWLLRQLVNLLYADGKTGKTILMMHLAIARGLGVALFGHKVRPGPTLLVLCEDAYDRTKNAMEKICARLGANLADLPITFVCTPADPLLAVIGDKGEREIRPFLLTLCELIVRAGPDCHVVLDTVSDVAELDEKRRLPPNTLLKKTLQPICDVFGVTVTVTAHPSEAQMRSGRGTSGGTGWKNSSRNVLIMEGSEAEIRKLSRRYSNYGSTAPLHLAINGPVLTAVAAPAKGDCATDTSNEGRIRNVLRSRAAYGFKHGLSDEDLAAVLIEPGSGPKPREDDVDAMVKWNTAHYAEKRNLGGNMARREWAKGRLHSANCLPGGTVPQRRWHLPEDHRPEAKGVDF